MLDVAPGSCDDVLSVAHVDARELEALLRRYGLRAVPLGAGAAIPGSYWGEREAGLVGDVIYFRGDTPVHSVLHEACHFVCMDSERRARLYRDAGGDYDEENAVCYLQIVLADELARVGRARMQRDMDAWGYTFRLGSAQAWFERDAEDPRDWLHRHRILDADAVTWRRRE